MSISFDNRKEAEDYCKQKNLEGYTHLTMVKKGVQYIVTLNNQENDNGKFVPPGGLYDEVNKD